MLIFCKLICNSYNVVDGEKLQLRNSWIEECPKDSNLTELCEKWKVDMDFPYPSKDSISNILVGEMELPNVVIHFRIVR